MFWGVFWPAFSGIIPAVVQSEGLQKGNALNQLLTNSGLIIGAACAGILIDQYGAAVTLTIDAASFMI